MQKCKFCGSNVIAPAELFQRPFGSGQTFDVSELTGRALKIAEIQREIQKGNKIMAIKIFRETFGVGLKEAKDAVEAMERGESIDISGMQVQVQRPRELTLGPEGVATVKKVGYALGGSIMGSIAFVIIIIALVIAAIIYFSVKSSGPSSLPGGSNVSVTTASPTPTPTPPVTEILKFGGEGTGAGKFKDNRHVAVNPSGRIFSGDFSGGRIQVFDEKGTFVTQWNAEPESSLHSLATDRRGLVYVNNSRGLGIYDGETGKLMNQLKDVHARNIAVGLDGRLVLNIGMGITILDANLNKIAEIKDAAEKASSKHGFTAIAIDGTNHIYALDRTNGDVCRFAPDGKFLNRFSSNTGSSVWGQANSIAIDPAGRIFVARTSDINVFDESGKALNYFKATQAFGITFNDSGELFVASRPYVVKYKVNF